MLRAWDGGVDPGSPAPTLYQSLLTVLMNSLLSDEVPQQTLEFLQFYFNADPLLFGILEDPANPAWENRAAVRPSSRTGTPVPRGLAPRGEAEPRADGCRCIPHGGGRSAGGIRERSQRVDVAQGRPGSR